jgi:hypothetical protein
MAGNTLGYGTPIALTPPLAPFGSSPFGGMNIGPFTVPFAGPSALSLSPAVQQIVQLLQIVPQQLQHLLQLEYLQQQQLQQLQQVVQLLPAQFAHLQQLIQYVPQHAQQIQPFAPALPAVSPWGVSPQIVGAQPGYVM